MRKMLHFLERFIYEVITIVHSTVSVAKWKYLYWERNHTPPTEIFLGFIVCVGRQRMPGTMISKWIKNGVQSSVPYSFQHTSWKHEIYNKIYMGKNINILGYKT